MKIKIIIIPGYHGAGEDILSGKHQIWFAWLKKELEKLEIEVIAKDYPDAYLCRAENWLPFIKKLGGDENSILIGHSTGAIAAMRFAEENRILGSVLVGSYYTDLGDPEENESGYFDNPWQWEKIKNNQKWVIQFHSTDDPWISNEEAHMVNKMLDTELHEYHDRGHFGGDKKYLEFPELLDALKRKLNVN